MATAANGEVKLDEIKLDEESFDATDLRGCHLGFWHLGGKGMANEDDVNKYDNPLVAKQPGLNFQQPDEKVLSNIIVLGDELRSTTINAASASGRDVLRNGAVRGNVTKKVYWNPTEVKAGLVTAGGLCPGLNSIIREVTQALWRTYGVQEILGFQSGWNGLSDMDRYEPIKLTNNIVREIHLQGGSILKAGRGGFDAEKICKNLEARGVNMLFVIGGDGTQKAGNMLFEHARTRQLKISIVGVPKSIDNDVLFFDRTFGFDTAVAAASDVIRSAWTEAKSCDKGVGIVKLMGRDAGFVVQNVVVASTIVDVALIPEIPFKLEDVLKHVEATCERKGFCVIVVAEGAGQDHVATNKRDATGHNIYGDIGTFLRDQVNSYMKPKGGRSFYIDPSYVIRSVPIRPNDHIYCTRLAINAVHTAMRGYTGVCVGSIHDIVSIVPSKFVGEGKRQVSVKSRMWQVAVESSNMPASLSGLA